MIARDTMHHQQWLSVIEEMGGHKGTLPIPNSFPRSQEHNEFNDNFFATAADGSSPEKGRWTEGKSLDGNGKFTVSHNKTMGQGQ